MINSVLEYVCGFLWTILIFAHISGNIRLSDKQVLEIMTPLEDTYCLSADTILDQEKVAEVYRQISQ